MQAYLHRQIHEQLLRAQHPVFICDERLDGDSLGSSLALIDYLKAQGKQVSVFVSEEIPKQYQFLPHIEHTTTHTEIFDDPTIDLVVVFDCSDANFVRSLVERIPSSPVIINIDHHATNPRYGMINQVVVEAPATAEVVYQFFQENHLLVSAQAATCLLAGICFDTTIFSNSATGEAALSAASNLILCGGRIQEVIQQMYQSRSIVALRLWGEALGRLSREESSGAVFTFLTHEDMATSELLFSEIEGLSNFIHLVVDASTVFVIRETPQHQLKISMRSTQHDVSRIAKSFGGGGHQKAAGFLLERAKYTCDSTGCRRLVEECMSMVD